jgi:hypothetical protein
MGMIQGNLVPIGATRPLPPPSSRRPLFRPGQVNAVVANGRAGGCLLGWPG